MSAVQNQRTFERIPFCQKVKVESKGRVVAFAIAVNVGMGGVLLSAASLLPVGSQCRVAIPVPRGEGAQFLEAEGTVVRNSAGETAVQFSKALERTRFDTLFQQSAGASLGSILASYQAYYRVSRDKELAECEQLLGVSKQTYRTTVFITFCSCISLAVLSAWLLRNSLPASPNWIKVVLSFGYGAIWLALFQPAIDLTIFHFLKQHRTS